MIETETGLAPESVLQRLVEGRHYLTSERLPEILIRKRRAEVIIPQPDCRLITVTKTQKHYNPKVLNFVI